MCNWPLLNLRPTLLIRNNAAVRPQHPFNMKHQTLFLFALSFLLSASLHAQNTADQAEPQPAPETRPDQQSGALPGTANRAAPGALAPPPAVAVPPGANPFGQPGSIAAQQQAQAAMRQRYGLGGQFPSRLRNIVRRGSGEEPLIIRSSEMDPKQQAHLDEDLAIMHHLLAKNANEISGQSEGFTAMGINVINMFGQPGPNPLRSVYLDGYGALFLLNVDFPLLPPPSEAKTSREEAPQGSAWEEAKQEMFGAGPNGPMRPGAAGFAYGPPASSQEPFSQRKVDRLRDSLLGTLKNAVNIRGLKDSDEVTVCVFGAPRGSTTQNGAGAGIFGSAGGGIGMEPMRPRAGTIMTIRAKLADIAAYAKANAESEAARNKFHKEVQVQIYEGSGADGAGAGIAGFGGGIGSGDVIAVPERQ